MIEKAVSVDDHHPTHAEVLRIERVPQHGGTLRPMNDYAITIEPERFNPTLEVRVEDERHSGTLSLDMHPLSNGRPTYSGDEPSHIHIPRPGRRTRFAGDAPLELSAIGASVHRE